MRATRRRSRHDSNGCVTGQGLTAAAFGRPHRRVHGSPHRLAHRPDFRRRSPSAVGAAGPHAPPVYRARATSAWRAATPSDPGRGAAVRSDLPPSAGGKYSMPARQVAVVLRDSAARVVGGRPGLDPPGSRDHSRRARQLRADSVVLVHDAGGDRTQSVAARGQLLPAGWHRGTNSTFQPERVTGRPLTVGRGMKSGIRRHLDGPCRSTRGGQRDGDESRPPPVSFRSRCGAGAGRHHPVTSRIRAAVVGHARRPTWYVSCPGVEAAVSAMRRRTPTAWHFVPNLGHDEFTGIESIRPRARTTAPHAGRHSRHRSNRQGDEPRIDRARTRTHICGGWRSWQCATTRSGPRRPPVRRRRRGRYAGSAFTTVDDP